MRKPQSTAMVENGVGGKVDNGGPAIPIFYTIQNNTWQVKRF